MLTEIAHARHRDFRPRRPTRRRCTRWIPRRGEIALAPVRGLPVLAARHRPHDPPGHHRDLHRGQLGARRHNRQPLPRRPSGLSRGLRAQSARLGGGLRRRCVPRWTASSPGCGGPGDELPRPPRRLRPPPGGARHRRSRRLQPLGRGARPPYRLPAGDRGGGVAARGPGGPPDRPPARLPAGRRPHPRHRGVRPAARTLPRSAPKSANAPLPGSHAA